MSRETLRSYGRSDTASLEIIAVLNSLQKDPREVLDLSSHACRTVEVSFAVVNSEGPSRFSETVTLMVYGGS